MDTIKQTVKRDAAMRKIIAALMDGRSLSVYDSAEFGVSEMHTCFCKIRQKIQDGKISGYEMWSAWNTNENGIRYKVYWFVASLDCIVL